MNICSSCDYPTTNYTWLRQRIVCRRCWELMGREPVGGFVIKTQGSGEEE